MARNKTMIRISKDVRKALKTTGNIGDSYDKVLKKILKKEGLLK